MYLVMVRTYTHTHVCQMEVANGSVGCDHVILLDLSLSSKVVPTPLYVLRSTHLSLSSKIPLPLKSPLPLSLSLYFA